MFRIRDRAHTRRRALASRPLRPLGLPLAAAVAMALSAVPTAASAAVHLPVPWPLPLPLPEAAGDQLTVEYDDGSGAAVSRTLNCHPAGGSHQDARGACDRLDTLGGPLGPVPRGRMCSQLYGGPQTAHITGTWGGEPVDEAYSRTDGCQTARWRQMEPVLPDPGAASQTDAL